MRFVSFRKLTSESNYYVHKVLKVLEAKHVNIGKIIHKVNHDKDIISVELPYDHLSSQGGGSARQREISF